MTDLRDQLHGLFGHQTGGVPLHVPSHIARHDLGGWGRDDLLFQTDGTEAIPARLLRPADGGPCPVVLYCHAHGNRYDTGCVALQAGRPALHGPHLPDLMALGIGALCLEMPCFGARQGCALGGQAPVRADAGGTISGY